MAEEGKIDQWSFGEYFLSGVNAADADVLMGIAPSKDELES